MSRMPGMVGAPGSFRPARPGFIRPIGDIPIEEISKRIARDVSPTLYNVQEFVAFSGQAVKAIGSSALAAGDVVKDFGGAANAGAEQFFKASALTRMRLSGEQRALAGAAAHARVAGQIGFDLVRARVAVSQAEEAVKYFKSPAAESALVFMRPELEKLQSAFESERGTQGKYREITASLKSKSTNIGQMAHAAEMAASRSMIGRGILSAGRFLAHPGFGNSMIALGVGLASIKGYVGAPTDSTAWKAGYAVSAGAVAGLSDLGVAAHVAKGGNPLTLFWDPAVNYGAKALGSRMEAMGYKEGGKKIAEVGENLTVGKLMDDSARNIVAMTQGLTTGDTSPLGPTHERNMGGSSSIIIQGYAMIGEALSRSSLVDAAMTKTADWLHDVPSEFQSSPSWWSALKEDAGTVLDVAAGAATEVKEAVTGSSE